MLECNNDANVVLDNLEKIRAAAKSQMVSTFNNGMTKITLRDCHLDTTVAAMVITVFRNNKSRIKELEIDNCSGSHLGTVLTAAFTYCTMLESLSIYFGTSSRSTDFEPLIHALGVGLLTNSSIRKLVLSVGWAPNCSTTVFTMTSDAARSLEQGLRGNTTLSSLHIIGCRFGERGALRIFATGLQCIGSLRDVRISGCHEPNGQRLEDHSVAHLIRSLEHCSELESLDVSSNKCLDAGMIALASLLDNTQIRKLNISSQNICHPEFMNTFHLVGALGRTSTLETLDLGSNRLSSDYDMANIAAALTHNTSVKHIYLKGNNIRSSAMNILSSRIPSMKVLESLYISDDLDYLYMNIGENLEYDDEMSKNLARGMKENSLIRRIECDERLADYTIIQYYADLNWAGRRYITQNNGEAIAFIPSALWPKILSRIGNLSKHHERQANAIYFLLQQGSAIFPV